MLSKYIEKASKLYKNIDGLVVVDSRGIICHYENYRPEINRLTPELVINRKVTEVWTDLNEESSTLLTVLRTGEPIINNFQEYTNCLGIKIKAINTTMPLTNSAGDIIGAMDVSVYLDDKKKSLSLASDDAYRPQKLFKLDDIITRDPRMIELKQNVDKIASTNSSVLIYGETGTGKELVAQSIHTSSGRKDKPFIVQNCAAIPNTLLESMLFGTVKGSYTGAENRKGLFELADGGTIFLDEINSMEMNMQSKILRVLEEKKAKRIGGEEEICFDVRVISAVNENPSKLLSGKILRTDLFYRLSPVQIILPPLRERRGDIALLADHFIRHFNRTMHRNILGMSSDALTLLCDYYWPGNVRELKNIIEGCFNIVRDGFLTREDIPPYVSASITHGFKHPQDEDSRSLDEKVRDFEKQLILDALSESRSLSAAARALSITRQNLRYKIEKHGIDTEEMFGFDRR